MAKLISFQNKEQNSQLKNLSLQEMEGIIIHVLIFPWRGKNQADMDCPQALENHWTR